MNTVDLSRLWRMAIFAAFLLGTNVAQAAKVLYYYDFYVGADYWTAALTARGDTVTTVTSSAALVTQLTAGAPWDAVVVSENNFDTSAVWATPIANYVTAGGRLVLNNWYNNAVIDGATQAAAGAPNNQTSATINGTGIAAGLMTGIVTNPITLTNTGWGVFSQALTPNGGAVSYCDFPVGSCAVFGNSGRTMRLGFIPDTLPAADASQLLQNALAAILAAPPPAPVGIPTLSQWGMALTMLLLGLTALGALRRRRG